MDVPSLNFINASQLKDLIKNDSNKCQVVDVRDEDFAGGHISGAMNVPVDQFEDVDNVDELIKELEEAGKKEVVFHCMLSQVRGPMCAQRFLARLSQSNTPSPCQVYVLEGGYRGWLTAADEDPELQHMIENS